MTYKSFPIGIHPPDNKTISLGQPVRECPLPDTVTIPLAQHIGKPAEPVVAVGDTVKAGTLIAQRSGFVSSNIHASLSGTVKAIGSHPHPVSGKAQAITIESDHADTAADLLASRALDKLHAEDIRAAIDAAGIVGMGGAGFPTHVKVSPPADKPIDVFILNGTECEPYLTCDHALMLEKTKELIEGMRLAIRMLGARQGIIALEANKLDVVRVFRKALAAETFSGSAKTFSVEVLTTQYPHGAEKQLIKAVTGREVPHKGLPMDIGCLVQNVGTIYAVYEACLYGKPLYQRVITVTGSSITEPGNLRVRVGTSINHVLAQCGGLPEHAGKVIMGGPMMGITQYSLDVPVIKGTSGILVLTASEAPAHQVLPCIHCAACVDVCPMNILPTDIARLSERGLFDRLSEYYPEACIECGNCSYVCPSKIPLVQLIRLGKQKMPKD